VWSLRRYKVANQVTSVHFVRFIAEAEFDWLTNPYKTTYSNENMLFVCSFDATERSIN